MLVLVLIIIVGVALGYFFYRNEPKTETKGFARVVLEEFLGILATILFGIFGFSWDQFIQRIDESNLPAKD